MAYARDVNDYTSEIDGLTAPLDRQFDVTFPYIAKEHVVVLVNGTQTYDFFWVNDNRIELDNKPTVGDVITVVRETSPAVRLVDYQTGSVLSEEILDQDSLQGFYLAQEANDIKDVAMAKNATENWEGDNRRLTNLAEPVDSGDAVTLGFLGSNLNAITNVSQNIASVKEISDNMDAINQVTNTLDSIATISEGDTADNINYFGAYYKIGTTTPSGVEEGTVWFDTQTDTLRVYNGTTFQPYNTSTQTEFQGLSVNADGNLIWTHGTADDTFDTNDYADWFFALSDVTILIDTDGHLKVRY